MVGTIGFLVQDTSNRRRWLISASLYSLACLASSVALGGFLSAVGLALRLAVGPALSALVTRDGIAIVGLFAIAYSLSDIGLLPMPRPAVLFAVPLTWWRHWRPYGAALAYGAALGLGVMTYVPFGAFYVLCMWCLLQGNILYGSLLLGTYGCLRGITLLPASWIAYRSSRGSEDINERLAPLLRSRWWAQRIISTVLMVFGVQLLMSLGLSLWYGR